MTLRPTGAVFIPEPYYMNRAGLLDLPPVGGAQKRRYDASHPANHATNIETRPGIVHRCRRAARGAQGDHAASGPQVLPQPAATGPQAGNLGHPCCIDGQGAELMPWSRDEPTNYSGSGPKKSRRLDP